MINRRELIRIKVDWYRYQNGVMFLHLLLKERDFTSFSRLAILSTLTFIIINSPTPDLNDQVSAGCRCRSLSSVHKSKHRAKSHRVRPRSSLHMCHHVNLILDHFLEKPHLPLSFTFTLPSPSHILRYTTSTGTVTRHLDNTSSLSWLRRCEIPTGP